MNIKLKKSLALILILLELCSTAVAESVGTPTDLSPPTNEAPAINEKSTIAQSSKSLKEQLDPDRNIKVHVHWDGEELYYGDEIELIAILNGYDNAIYTLQWQESADSINWINVEGGTNDHLCILVTEENHLNYWRIVVIITGIIDTNI